MELSSDMRLLPVNKCKEEIGGQRGGSEETRGRSVHLPNPIYRLIYWYRNRAPYFGILFYGRSKCCHWTGGPPMGKESGTVAYWDSSEWLQRDSDNRIEAVGSGRSQRHLRYGERAISWAWYERRWRWWKSPGINGVRLRSDGEG